VLQIFVTLGNLILARVEVAIDEANPGFRQFKRYLERAFIAHGVVKAKW